MAYEILFAESVAEHLGHLTAAEERGCWIWVSAACVLGTGRLWGSRILRGRALCPRATGCGRRSADGRFFRKHLREGRSPGHSVPQRCPGSGASEGLSTLLRTFVCVNQTYGGGMPPRRTPFRRFAWRCPSCVLSLRGFSRTAVRSWIPRIDTCGRASNRDNLRRRGSPFNYAGSNPRLLRSAAARDRVALSPPYGIARRSFSPAIASQS